MGTARLKFVFCLIPSFLKLTMKWVTNLQTKTVTVRSITHSDTKKVLVAAFASR